MASNHDEAQRLVISALAQHTAYLHRTGTAHINQVNAIINEMGGELARELSDRLDGLSPAEMQAFVRGRYHTTRLKGLRNTLDKWIADLGERIQTLSIEEIRQLADHEAGYVRDLIAETVEGRLPAAPAAASAVMAKPVMGEFVEDMLADIPARTKQRVYSRIRQGIAEGEANSEIIRALRGTPTMRYRDGLLQTTRNQVETIVRTARQHASNEAYLETYEALGVTEVVWVASLEGRTCIRCSVLDGQRWGLRDPRPEAPLHPRCRCSVAPSFSGEIMGRRPYVRALKVRGRDGERGYRSIGNMTQNQRQAAGLKVGQVQANTTFQSWFDNQDAAFKREWLGPSRYKLYRSGGYSLDRFIDPRGAEYTLDQLRQRDTQTFAELFG